MKGDLGAATGEGIGRGIRILARAGYAAKGLVYGCTGGLSAMAAFGAGSRNARGSREALASVGQGTSGFVLLVLVAAGMAGYVVWQLVQVFRDPEGRGSDAKGLIVRSALFISACVYAALDLWILEVLLSGSGGRGAGQGSGGDAKTWSAVLLAQPYGTWLLGLFGSGVVVLGFAEWVRAYRASFQSQLRHDLSGHARSVLRKVARVGLASRGVVFLIIGGFLVNAAATSDPSQAQDLEGALTTLARQRYGPWLMGALALGLVAYGVFQVAKARYRRIGPLAEGDGARSGPEEA